MALYVDPNKMQFIHGVYGVAFAAAKTVSLFLSQRKEKDGKQRIVVQYRTVTVNFFFVF